MNFNYNFSNDNLDKDFQRIIEKFLSGLDISIQEGVVLFKARGKEQKILFNLANSLREKINGNKVSFVINRNINFTNVCHMGCSFCGFAKKIQDKNSEWLSFEEIVLRSKQAWNRGATEVCIQGGLHPKLPSNYYLELIKSIKKELPDIHIHAFSPFEIWYGAAKSKKSYYDFISELKEHGLGSMPGTAAEILDNKVRSVLTKNKLSAKEWIKIITTAHKVGLPSTATIMYGHVDKPIDWANHLDIIRNIQRKTNGFTEFVPLSFIYENSPLYLENKKLVRKGPTLDEVYNMHAVSRIMLSGYIENIQVSWTKLGPQVAQNTLDLGVNDFGGTLMNESISRAAGSKYGQEITSLEMVKIIRASGKIPIQRNTLYKTIKTYEDNDPNYIEPLVPRGSLDPIKFLNQKPNSSKLSSTH